MDYNIDDFDDIELDGIDTNDYPDFVDAYISSATYQGDDATDDQLDWLNEHLAENINEMVFNHLF